ncbi:MFS transporter [Phytomonospora sp. NPDC050363]|uniref:MFS transporter n=1 Tax=Phytomonospora sp. NPDC050363 TaxID=3155642 RepID=UPI0033C40290
MRSLWKNHNLRVYVAGQTLSGIGDSSLWLAAAIWVNEITGSAGAAGIVMFCFGVSALAGPVVGLVVDRVRRRELLVAANLLGVVLVLPMLFVDGKGAVWTVYAVMFGYGVLNRIVTSAQNALISSIVPDELLADANGVLRTLQESMRILLPLAGAGLYVWAGIEAVVILDIVTFMAAAGLFTLLKVTQDKPKKPEPGTSLRREAMAGIHYLRRQPVLMPVVGGAVVAALVFGFTESGLFAVATDGLGKSGAFVGVIAMVQGVGAVIAGLFTGAIARRIGAVRLTAVGLGGFAVSMLLTTIPSLPLVLFAAFFAGLTVPLSSVGAVTCLQRYTPDELQGRVYSAADMAFTAASTASIALGSGLVGYIGYQPMYFVGAAVLVLGALIALTGRGAEARATAAKAAEPKPGTEGEAEAETPAAKPSPAPSEV